MCLIWWLGCLLFVLISCMHGSQTKRTLLTGRKVISEASFVGVEMSLFWKTVVVGVSKADLAVREHHSAAWIGCWLNFLWVVLSLLFPLEARLPFVLNTNWSQNEISLHSSWISQLTRCMIAAMWAAFSLFLGSSLCLWLSEAEVALC